MNILILPGLYNSDEAHWQSIWEKNLPNAQRVQQANWEIPERDAWVSTLSAAVNDSKEDVILVAHSLGCALTAWWVALDMPGVFDKHKVKAALLVAPPDVNRSDFPAPSFSPMPVSTFPFPGTVIASGNDPWCDLDVARVWATSWNTDFHHIGAKGHINGDSGLLDWKQGQYWLMQLIEQNQK